MTSIAGPSLAQTIATPAPPAGGEREKLAGAARQFEAIFVRQMLAAARQANFGDELFGSQGADTFRDMQHSRFADLAADTGAFGLAKQIEAHLARFVNGGASPAPAEKA